MVVGPNTRTLRFIFKYDTNVDMPGEYQLYLQDNKGHNFPAKGDVRLSSLLDVDIPLNIVGTFTVFLSGNVKHSAAGLPGRLVQAPWDLPLTALAFIQVSLLSRPGQCRVGTCTGSIRAQRVLAM